MESKRSQPLFILAGIIFYLVCLAFLGWLGLKVVVSHRYLHQGVVYGEPPDIPLASVYPLGVNVSLEQYEREEDLRSALGLARKGGFHWIRQHFPWAQIEPERGDYSWEKWDRIVALAQEYGLTLIAVLDTSPLWARAPMDNENPYAPPTDFADYNTFVSAFASRYGSQIDYYEIWDEPNIYPHWGERYVHPLAYVHLLQGAYGAIKGADSSAFVLSAGLAPNVEPGGRNMSDLLFLQEMYEAGAKGYFDILAIKPYGFWSGPEDRRLDPNATNFSRAVLLRQVMLRNRDNKAVWAVEFGWNSLPLDWVGEPPPWGSDTEEVQAKRTMEAIRRASDEWPWLGVMALMHLQPNAPPDDPVHGFALLDESFSSRLTYQEVASWAAQGVPASPGHHPADSWAAQYEGRWKKTALSAMEGSGRLDFSFRGNGLDLILTDPFDVRQMTIDGQEVKGFLSQERGIIDFSSEGKGIVRYEVFGYQQVALARGLPDGVHILQLVTEREGGIIGFIVRREADFKAYYLSLALLVGAAMVVSWRLGRLILLEPSQRMWRRLANPYLGLAEWQQIGLLALALGLYYFSPWTLLSLVSLAMVAALLYLRLDLGLAFIALSIPFFLYPKPLLGKVFSLVETLTLLSFLLWLLKTAIGSWQEALKRYKKDSSFELQEMPWGVWLLRELPSFIPYWVCEFWRSLTMLDMGLLFFLLLSLFSLTVSENFGVSAREFRVVVLESALFYLLLREVPQDKGELWRIVDGLVAAAVIVSLYGLFQYFFTADVIVAEGVRRIRGVYGSPNNLSLFLGRVLPLTLAISLFGTGKNRRLAYGAASLPMVVCLFLTFSRGAWLLGVPAAILFLGLMRGRRAFLAALGGVGAAILALLPFAGLARLTSLLSLQEGTTQRRLALWKAALQMIRDHPIFGVGLDNFLYHYPRYILPEAWQEPDLSHPHNLVLHWWVSLGVFGVGVLIWLQIAFWRSSLRLYQRLKEPDLRLLTLGLMASMVDFLAHGLVDQSYFLVDLAFIFCLTLGIIRRMEIFERREV